MMKKLLAILLCLVMVLSVALFTGCSEEKKADDKADKSSAAESTESKDEPKDEPEDEPEDEPAETTGTCESCGKENVSLTYVEYEGESANLCDECKALVDSLIDMEDDLDDMMADLEIDDTSAVGDWQAMGSDGVAYTLTVSADGNATMTASSNGKTESLDCTWDLVGTSFTLYNDVDDTVGVFDGTSIDFSAEEGPVFTR